MSTFDFHVHCYPEDLAERAVAAMSVVANTQTDGTWDQQLAYMSHHDVSHCVGLNMAKTPGSMHKVNLFAVSSMRPQQLIFGSVHPQADNVMEELELFQLKKNRKIPSRITLFRGCIFTIMKSLKSLKI